MSPPCVDVTVVAGGSCKGFIAMEYAVAYPDHTPAMVMRDFLVTLD